MRGAVFTHSGRESPQSFWGDFRDLDPEGKGEGVGWGFNSSLPLSANAGPYGLPQKWISKAGRIFSLRNCKKDLTGFSMRTAFLRLL